MAKTEPIFRVIYVQHDQVCEVYCRKAYQSDLYGFIAIEGLIFGERSKLLVDPGEERLKQEFAGVTCSYIPMQWIQRIDQVTQEGAATMRPQQPNTQNVKPFPSTPSGAPRKPPQ